MLQLPEIQKVVRQMLEEVLVGLLGWLSGQVRSLQQDRKAKTATFEKKGGYRSPS